VTEPTLDLLLQEREIKKLLDEHLEQTVTKVEAITGRFEARSNVILSAVDTASKELSDTRIAVAKEIADAKKDIGELAVQRTLSIFTEGRNAVFGFLALGLTILVTSGLIGYSSLKSGVTAFVDAKVREWMSVSTPNSPVKETLEKLRNDAVLDALSIKLDREGYNEQSQLPSFNLSEDEKSRLCQVMLDPDTSDSAFQDASRLIEASKAPFAGDDDDLQLKDVIDVVMRDSKYSNRKRFIVFENLWREPALLNASFGALDEKGIPDAWALYAFKNISKHIPQKAETYAIKMLSSQGQGNQRVAADFLAANDPLNPALLSWLNDIRSKGTLDYPVTRAALATEMMTARVGASSFSTEDHNATLSPAVQSAAAELLYEAIHDGVHLRISRFDPDPVNVAWEHTVKNSTHFERLERAQLFFDNDSLLTAVLSKSSDSTDELAKMISALEVPDGQNYLASIQLTLPVNGWLEAQDRTRITTAMAIGSIRLSMASGQLTATWREPDGKFMSAKILSGSRLTGAHYNYSTDQLRVSEMDLHNESEWY
jgi:hypothetical protein